MRDDKSKLLNTNTLLLFCCVFFLSGCMTIPIGNDSKVSTSFDKDGGLTISVDVVMVVDNSEIEKYTSVEPVLPDNFEVGYSPIGIPLRIAIDSTGTVLISVEPSLITPIGVFDITASKNIIDHTQTRFLSVQTDDTVNLFELKNEDFKIDFYNNGDFYRIISFQQDSKRNIELVLQSIK